MKLQFFHAQSETTSQKYVAVRLVGDNDWPLYATRVVGVGLFLEDAVRDLENDCSLWLCGPDRVEAMDLCNLFLRELPAQSGDPQISDSKTAAVQESSPAEDGFLPEIGPVKLAAQVLFAECIERMRPSQAPLNG